MDKYDSYSQIETHMRFAKDIFGIDSFGKYILDQLNEKKSIRKTKFGRSIFNKSIEQIYNVIVDIVNIHRFKLRLYFVLQYYMDELMFREIKHGDTFYIGDESYQLTQLYLAGSLWVVDYNPPNFILSPGPNLNERDINNIVLFLRKYEDVLYNIKNYIRDKDDRDVIKKKLYRVINRIRTKHRIIWDSLTLMISSD